MGKQWANDWGSDPSLKSSQHQITQLINRRNITDERLTWPPPCCHTQKTAHSQRTKWRLWLHRHLHSDVSWSGSWSGAGQCRRAPSWRTIWFSVGWDYKGGVFYCIVIVGGCIMCLSIRTAHTTVSSHECVYLSFSWIIYKMIKICHQACSTAKH